MKSAYSASSDPLPLFIVGVARSGTSFLHDLLNGHPAIRLSYESKIFGEGWQCYHRHRNLAEREGFENLLREFVACDRDEPKNRWVVETIRTDSEQLFLDHRRSASFAGLIEQIYQLPGPVRCWGNKMLRIEMCPDVLAHWPQAKFIVLIRDPRAVYASQREKFQVRRVRYSAIYWDLHAQWTDRVAGDCNHYFVVRYEDFVSRPMLFLEKILGFAGVWDRGIAAKMLEAQPPFATSLNKWRDSLNINEIGTVESICFERMKRFGYVAEQAAEQKKLSGISRALETLIEHRDLIPLNPAAWRRKSLLRRLWITVRG